MVRFSVQLPTILNHWLEGQAQQNQRSKNAEVVYILEQFWRKQARTIRIMTGYNLPCNHDRHYFKQAAPGDNDICNCGKVRW